MRVLFAGTPEAALPSLRALLDSPAHEVVGVLTRPDARRGRGLAAADRSGPAGPLPGGVDQDVAHVQAQGELEQAQGHGHDERADQGEVDDGRALLARPRAPGRGRVRSHR